MTKFRQIVVWGHPLHSHTHSYIHEGFYRAAKFMGYEALWVSHRDDISGIDFSNSLFITEVQAFRGMPQRDDCKYVLHNCSHDLYRHFEDRVLKLQVYTDNTPSWDVEKISDGVYYFRAAHTIFFPWGTDLLPSEFDESLVDTPRARKVYWVGTIGGGEFGNKPELDAYAKACRKVGVEFVPRSGVESPEHKMLIARSYMAPAIEGRWQVGRGYVACRVFKNASYGQMPGTNCLTAHRLFGERLVYNADCYKLFFDLERRRDDRAAVLDLMRYVRDNHTYVNRIQAILSVI